MQASGKLDDREWQQAMRQYRSLSSKDFVTIANTKAVDLLFKSAKEAPKAVSTTISGLKNEPWWPKYVASVMTSKYGKGHFKRKEYIREAKKLSRTILKARRQRVGYAKAGFIKSANSYPKRDPKRSNKNRSKRPQKEWKGIKTSKTLASIRATKTTFTIDWDAKSGSDARGKQRIADVAIRRGLRGQTRDMKKYIERKLSKQSKRISV